MSLRIEPILIVDDSKNDASLLIEALEEVGVENPVIELPSCQEAREYFLGWGRFRDRQNSPSPAVVFLDINLPEESGFELLQWMRTNESTAGLVVLMMSASSRPEDISRSYALGANSYLMKPDAREDLVKTLQHFRVFWLEAQRYT